MNARGSIVTSLGLGIGLALTAAVLWRIFGEERNSQNGGGSNGNGHQGVPPSATSPMTPQASSWVSAENGDGTAEKQPAIVDTPERRQAIELYHVLKAQANSSFQRGALEESLQHYQDAVDVLAAIPGDADADVIQLSQVVRANVVLVFLKMGRNEDARMLATFLLQDDVPPPIPLLCKVLFRRAAAMVKLGDINGAVSDLEAAQHFSPNHDSTISSELERVRKLLPPTA